MTLATTSENPALELEQAFLREVSEALKGDHNYLRREQIILRALRTALIPQPIDTAPKDGTVILGFAWRRRSDGGDRIYRCWWQPEFDGWITSAREMTLAADYRFADGSRRQLHSPDMAHPTHWMPMPDQPQEARS